MNVRIVDADDPPLLTLHSPAVRLSPPRIHDRDRIPAGTLAILEPIWRRSELPERTVRFDELRRVHVASEGLVFDETGERLFGPSVTQHGSDEIAAASDAIRRGRAAGSILRHDRPAILCKKRGAGNYGHWLVEMLPLAFTASRQPALGGLDVCIHAATDPLRGVMHGALHRIGIPRDRIVETTADPVFFDRLVVVDGLTSHGSYVSPLVIPCFAELRDTPHPTNAPGLYVARRTHRDFLNRSWLQTRALWEGIDVLDPSTFKFEDQVALFADRRRIAGVAGAGLANCVFATPGTRLLTFVPASMCDTFYWLLASLLDLDYEECRCEETGPRRGPAEWDRDLLIRARLFRDLLSGRGQNARSPAATAFSAG